MSQTCYDRCIWAPIPTPDRSPQRGTFTQPALSPQSLTEPGHSARSQTWACAGCTELVLETLVLRLKRLEALP